MNTHYRKYVCRLIRKGMLSRGLLMFAAAIIFAACGSNPPDDILGKAGQAGLVFVKENSAGSNNNNAMKTNRDEFHSGSDIFLLRPISPSGELKNLTAQYTREGEDNENNWGHACDPEISMDGKKILFSMKTRRQARWHLYEMDVNGDNLVQLTDQDEGEDMDPVYLPNGQVLFSSTRPGIVDEYERRAVSLLHVADRAPDGRLVNIRQISFNQSHDTNPMIHSSGKVFYSRWEHLGSPNKFPLFVMNPDGTRPFVLYGNHSPRQSGSRVFLEPRELSDGGLVCSVMERNSRFEGGAIGIIDISDSDDNITFITPDTSPFRTGGGSQAIYKSPHPILDPTAPADRRERILFAMSPIPINQDGQENRVDYGIYIMDKDGKNTRLIYNDPEYNEVDAVPVMPRADLPGGEPSVIPTDPLVAAGIQSGAETGFFFDANVYERAPNDGQMRPDPNFVNKDGSIGQVKWLRILEAIPMPISRNNRGGPLGNTNFEKQRVVGYAPVRSDGSFTVEVPANRSLHMQTLDENGMRLVNQRTWVQVMPGEKRLCTGCHGSHEKDKLIEDIEIQVDDKVMNTAEARTYESGFHNAFNVENHVAAKRDTVDFFDKENPNKGNTVQTVLNNRCVSCHGNSSPAGGLSLQLIASDLNGDDGVTSVYDRLTENGGYATANGNSRDYASRNGTRVSPLMWVLHGRQLDGDNDEYRQTSYDHTQLWYKDGNGLIDPFAPQNSDLLKLIEWMDAGIQYSNNSDM